MKVVVATGNAGKLREFKEILEGTGLDVVSMKDLDIESDPEETGESFEDNALIKARAVHAICHEMVLADDSGLVVDYLHGEPGIYSARYLGEDTPYSQKNKTILERMEGVPDKDRSARFIAAIACIYPDGREVTVRGIMEGYIAHEIAGEHGFGYDPIFYLPEYGKTSAQLTPEEKNAISHRGKALRLIRDKILEG